MEIGKSVQPGEVELQCLVLGVDRTPSASPFSPAPDLPFQGNISLGVRLTRKGGVEKMSKQQTGVRRVTSPSRLECALPPPPLIPQPQ